MREWIPYLEELLGDDPGGRAQIDTLLALVSTLREPPEHASARLRLVEAIGELSSVKQIFLLPWLLKLLYDPAPAVRLRMLREVGELLGGAQEPVLRLLAAGPGAAMPPERVVKALQPLFEAQGRMGRGLGFAAIISLREPVFGVSVLLAVADELARRGDQNGLAELRDALEAQPAMRDRLAGWLLEGPVFLRYLLVRWAGVAEFALIPALPVRRLLRERYEEDPDGVVAAAAVEGYTRTARPADTVAYLERELGTFRHRQLVNEHGERAAESARTVSVALLRALGNLAVEHLDEDAGAGRLLRRFWEMRPGIEFSLLPPPGRDRAAPDGEGATRFLQAAMLLSDGRARVCVRDRRGEDRADAGGPWPVMVRDLRGLREAGPPHFWAVPDWAALQDPFRGRFELVDVAERGPRGADELFPLITPLLPQLPAARAEERVVDEVAARIAAAVERRGPWMLATLEILVRLVLRSAQERSWSHPETREFFAPLMHMATAMSLVDYDGRGGAPWRNALKDRITALFLSSFVDQDALEALFPAETLDRYRAGFLVALTKPALRSVPQAPEAVWIDANLGLLRQVAADDRLPAKLRVTAASVLRVARAGAAPEPVAAVRLGEFFSPPFAVCAAGSEELEALRRGVFKEAGAPRVVEMQGSRKARNTVCAEVVARALEGEVVDPDIVRRAAVYCLQPPGEKKSGPTDDAAEEREAGRTDPGRKVPPPWLDPLTQRRLLQAFGRSPLTPEGILARMYDRLLRGARAADLDHLLRVRRAAGITCFDPVLHRAMDDALTGRGGGWLGDAARRLDAKAVEDHLLRRSVILRALAAEADAHPEDLLAEHAGMRDADPLPLATGTTAEVTGRLRSRAARPGGEVLADAHVVAPDAETLPDLGSRAVDLVAAFAHAREASGELRALVQYLPAPERTLDLLALPRSRPDRRKLLDRLMEEAPTCVVAGRVVAARGDGWEVDVGIDVTPVARSGGAAPAPGDTVLVQVSRVSTRWIPIGTQWKYHAAPPPGVEVRDLRREAVPEEALRGWWNEHGGKSRIVFPARVGYRRPSQGGRALCQFDAGFAHRHEGVDKAPVVFVEGEPPAEGAEIWVEPQRLQFEEAAGDGLGFRLLPAPVLPAGLVTAAWLRAALHPASRRLEWSAAVGGMVLPLGRADLTADHRGLLRIDAEAGRAAPADGGPLDPGHPLARALAERRVLVRVDGDGRASLLEVPPRWRLHDLLLAVRAGAVESIVFVRRAEGGGAVFEVRSREPARPFAPAGPVALFGTLVRLEPGELFAPGGEPQALDRLARGTRLRLEVRQGRPARDGAFVDAPGQASEWDEPYLALAAEPDASFAELVACFRRSTVQVAVVEDAGPERYILRELPPEYPPPRVVAEARWYRPGQEYSAPVFGHFDPWDAEYAVKVGKPEARTLVLDEGSAEREVRLLLQARRGTLLQGDLRIWVETTREGAPSGVYAFLNNLRVKLDPLLYHLLPERPDTGGLRSASVALRLTNVRVAGRQRLSGDPGLASIPFLHPRRWVEGLVCRAPASEGDRTAGIRWVAPPYAREERGISREWNFAYPDNKPEARNRPFRPRLGDRVRASFDAAGDPVLEHFQQEFQGSLAWPAFEPEQAFRYHRGVEGAVLLHKPDGAGGGWLFMLASGRLLEVEGDRLRTSLDLGADAWSLDVATLALTGEGARAEVEVRSLRPGPLHARVGSRVTFTCLFRDRDNGRYFGLLDVGRGGAVRLPIPVWLEPDELPAGRIRETVEQGITATQKPALECVLDGFQLNAERWTDPAGGAPLYTFGLRPVLSDPAARVERKVEQARDLEVELRVRGRLDDVQGRVVAVEDGFGVHLQGYRHSAPVPLPEDEQSWLPLTRDVGEGFRGRFCVTLDENGAPLASLRRRTPPQLDEWLSARGTSQSATVFTHPVLAYYGTLSEGEAVQCRLDPEGARGAGDPYVLFEIEPGDAFVARRSQLRFLGHAFDDSALLKGDKVKEYRVLPPKARGRVPLLDVRSIALGIVRQVDEFADDGGVFHAVLKIRRKQGVDTAEIEELWSRGFREVRKRLQPRGRFRLRLHPVDEAQLESIRQAQQGDYFYLVAAPPPAAAGEPAPPADAAPDPAHTGELWFRLVDAETAFTPGNLVFVSLEKIGRDDNDIPFVTVHPLRGSGGGVYEIGENRYSERTGRIDELGAADLGKILLAKVPDPGGADRDRRRGQPVELSLIDVPPRRFELLLQELRDDWHAVVKPPRARREAGAPPLEGEDAAAGRVHEVEVAPGVNVLLPESRIEGLEESLGFVRAGDVLVLRARLRQSTLQLRHVVHSQLEYLRPGVQHTVLTELWGTPEGREPLAKENRRVTCNLIGFPQLHGRSFLRPERAKLKVTLAQSVQRSVRDKSFVPLVDRVGEWWLVGRLEVEGDRPVLRAGRAHPLLWRETTFRDGTAAELSAALERMRWRNGLRLDRHRVERIADSDVLARSPAPNARLSLTAQADLPCPVDHLAQQLGARPREFVVARSGDGVVVLEVAPGRYTELPHTLIRPLEGELARGLQLDWEHLAPGDVLVLERSAAGAGMHQLLPAFSVRSVRYAARRPLDDPFVAPLRSEGRDTWIGLPGVAAVPGTHLEVLEDQLVDLRRYGDDAPGELRRRFNAVGPRLVLIGAVSNTRAVAHGTQYFLDVGIDFPLRDGRRGVPIYTTPPGAPPEAAGIWKVRVRSASWSDDGDLEEFRWDVRPPWEEQDSFVVRGEGCRAAPDTRPPKPGDSVLVSAGREGDTIHFRVQGFEHLAVTWGDGGLNDPLRLHQDSEHGRVFGALLAEPGSALWATVERVERGRVVLSRRVQLRRALPGAGRVVRARLCSVLDGRRLLVDLRGVPYALPLRNWCLGGPPESFVRGYLAAAPEPVEVEVALDPGGELSALSVYPPPPATEFEADVEHAAAEGLLVRAAGVRVFVAAAELAWCRPDAEGLQRLFPRGSSLRVVEVPGIGARTFSHIAVRDLRAERSALLRHPEEPVFVTRVWQATADGGGVVFVRTLSGLAMELHLAPGEEFTAAGRAYFQRVDDARRIVVLGLREADSRVWRLPAVEPAFALDVWTSGPIRQKRAELAAALASETLPSVGAWLRSQVMLEPSARNLRLVLETVSAAGAVVDWAAEAADDSIGPPLFCAWVELAGIVSAARSASSASPAACFGAGYHHLLLHSRSADPAEAAQSLRTAQELLKAAVDTWTPPPFDAGFALARALFQAGQRGAAAAMLRGLLYALWSNSLRTFALPAPPSGAVSPEDPLAKAWTRALEAGSAEKLLGQIKSNADPDPLSPESEARRVWLRLLEGPHDHELERAADSLLQAIRYEQADRRSVDPQLHLLAAFLEFARGDLQRGWWQLGECASHEARPDMQAAHFWWAWLADDAAGHAQADPLLGELAHLFDACRRGAGIPSAHFDAAWEAFRTSEHRWILELPPYRIVREPPHDIGRLPDWADEVGVPVGRRSELIAQAAR